MAPSEIADIKSAPPPSEVGIHQKPQIVNGVVGGYTLEIPEEWQHVHEKLNRSWERFNEAFFKGELTEPVILIKDPEPEIECVEELGFFGAYRFKDGTSFIGITSYLFQSLTGKDSPKFEAIKFKFAEDIILHEMVHQLIRESGAYDVNEEQHLGHGHKFAEACNRIGTKLGLSPVFVGQRPYCFAWPDSVRRIGHYIKPRSRLHFYERSLVLRILGHFASNGPDGGSDPDGGGGVVRLQSSLAA